MEKLFFTLLGVSGTAAAVILMVLLVRLALLRLQRKPAGSIPLAGEKQTWLAFHLAGQDMEMSCDEVVLRHMDRDVRADYSASLLRLSTGKRIPAGPLAFGNGNLQSRIKKCTALQKARPAGAGAALLAVLAVGAILAPAERRTNQPQARWKSLPLT